MDKRTQDRIGKVRRDAEDEIKRINETAERKAAQIEKIAKANEDARRASSELRARLEEENNVNRPHIRQQKRDLLWNKAWEHGHSSGLSEVEIWYNDLAELIQ